jgi:hypothetical protein
LTLRNSVHEFSTEGFCDAVIGFTVIITVAGGGWKEWGWRFFIEFYFGGC